MKIIKNLLLLFIGIAGSQTILAQTADDIINKHIAAIGGKDILSRINSIHLEGMTNAMGTDYPTQISVLAGKGFKSVTSVNNMEIIQVITDKSGWMQNPLEGQNGPVMLPAEAVKQHSSSLYIGGDLYNYAEKGFTDSLVGQELYQGVNAYKIKLSKPGVEDLYYIDPNTYYILKSTTTVLMNGNQVSNSSTFSDYKKTDFGYTLPYTESLNSMGYDVVLTYTKVEINGVVDPKIFDQPK